MHNAQFLLLAVIKASLNALVFLLPSGRDRWFTKSQL